ncbi:MAG: DUF924 domain-containing protein [Alphaproteobacteria bacterium]|nr:DUF924 domain-containing protein [Alphaproteobacteria bacterium]
MLTDPEEILNYWFYEVGPQHWFTPDAAVDDAIRSRFLIAHERAALDGLRPWEETPEGMLALLLLLDIFPRRMFCGTARAYATDETALDLARQAIIHHFDDRIDINFKLFFYLPFLHAENSGDQRLASFYIRERTKTSAWVDWANWSSAVIQRFGRFPHRNAVLGRVSTEEEIAFLETNQGKDDNVVFC